MNYEETRIELIDAAQELLRKGLVEGTSGNLSVRLADGNVAMTPSSLSYETMTPDQIAIVDLDGNIVEGEHGPTSEKDLHLTCLRDHPDLNAVIHCHAMYATMFASVREPVPPVVEEFLVYIGGEVPVAEHRESGSVALGTEVSRYVGDRSAVLMANHGLLTVGTTLARAMHAAALVERTAHIVWGARLLGKVHDIPTEVNEKFGTFYVFMR